MTMPSAREATVLVLMPIGDEATSIQAILTREGIAARFCADVRECVAGLAAGAEALLMAEEYLEGPDAAALFEALNAQPAWSDLPIIILSRTSPGRVYSLVDAAIPAAGSVRVINSPLEDAADLRALKAAVHRRRRQYVTSREQVEDALRESNERLRLAATAARLFAFEWDPITDLVRREGEAASVLGVSCNEETGAAYFSRIHPADRQRFVELVRSLHAGADTYTTTYRVIRPGGGESVLEESARALFDDQGRFVRLIGMAADVTAREQAQERLRQSEEFTRHITDIAPSILYVYDSEEGRIVWGNHELTTFLGFTGGQMDAIGGKWLRQLLAPEDLRRHAVHASRLLELADGVVAKFEYRMRHADGSWRWLHSRECVFRRSPDGRPKQIIGSALDVTASKIADETLRHSQEMLSSVFSGIEAAITVSEVLDDGRDFRFVAVNRAGIEWSGIPSEGWIGKHPADLFSPEHAEHLRARYREAFLLQKPIHYEECLAFPTGSIWALTTVSPLRNSEGRVHRIIATSIDISDLKAAEEQMRQSEARFRAMFDSHKAVKLVIEPDSGAIVDANQAAVEFYGYPREKLCAMSIDQINQLPPEEVAAERQRAMAQQRRYFEFPHLLANGEMRWVQVYSTPVPIQGRTLLYSILHDITDRKQAEQALLASELRYRNLFENMAEQVHFWELVRDSEGQILTWRLVDANPPALQSWGKMRDEVVGRNADEIVPGATAHFMPIVERIFTERKPFSYETYFQGLDQYLRLTSVPFGEYFITTGSDITEVKKAEVALREAHERLRLAKSAAQLGIFDYNPATGELNWDERVRELWGLRMEDPVNFDVFLTRLHPEDRAATQAAVDRALDPTGNGQYYAEYRVVRPDRTVWVAATGQVTFEGLRPIRLVGSVQDISDRKEFQAQLERLVVERTAKLQELVTELEHFSYSITHDLRAPLRTMAGFADMAAELCGTPNAEEQRNLIQRINQATARMDTLITDALSYSEAIRKHLPLAPVDPGQLLRGMLDTYPELQGPNIRIELQAGMHAVFANEAGLIQCFSNLLNNAIKFAKPGKPARIRIWSELRDRAPGTARETLAFSRPIHSTGFAGIPSQPDSLPREATQERWVRIWVEDDGVGISEAMLARVFNMFARGSSGQVGNGIGLALVRKVVDRMGGRVGVQSQEGKGSRFWVELLAAERTVPI